MNSMQSGTLKIKSKTNKKGNTSKSFEFFYTNTKGQYRSLKFEKISQDQIAHALLEKIEQSSNLMLTVEFEEEGDRILKLREQGQPWDREEIQEQVPQRNQPQEQAIRVQGDRFHNPYNFVPALPRDEVTGELGDRPPIGHGRYEAGYWSGRIAIKLTTVTPLLIPDAAEMTENNDHKTYPVRLGADGKPYLPPTSIKGMLRSAYEAVTNSRLSVFEKHDLRLAYRMPANSGLLMVPARIENNHVCLYPGTSGISNNGKPQRGDPMYAAWLRRWDRGSINRDRHAVTYAGTQDLPEHGSRVKFWAEKFSKGTIFEYWNVRKIVAYNQELGKSPTPTRSEGYGKHKPKSEAMRQFEGYVCATGKNIKNKHDERIFFSTEPQDPIPLLPEIRNRWTKLIESYQDNEDFKNRLQCPSALGNTAHWSRHFNLSEHEKKLGEGTLCYAYVSQNGSDFEIIDLYPVMIARSLYDKTPADILDSSLKPATDKNQLSPADRVFGWVNQQGNGSYKGQLRVHSVTCLRDDAVDDFGGEEASFPLAILGQPKPEQARFYCADDEDGKPLHNGENNLKKKDKGKGYSDENQNLRGRKVYPHHKGLSNNYWDNPLEDSSQQPDDTNRYQEYRRPQQNGTEQLDKQNRSIKGWVSPETTFQFEIDVINLSPTELGALLWLLGSPDIGYHRLGGGKPLGFGSVWLNVDWEQTDLRLGSDWATFYKSLKPEPAIIGNGLGCIDDFKQAVVSAYETGKRFEQIRFIAAFCNSSKGFDDAPIHYPRFTPNPTPEGEAFEWFVRNEQESNQERGLKLSLPDLADFQVTKLPLNPT